MNNGDVLQSRPAPAPRIDGVARTVGEVVASMAETIGSHDEARELLALLHDMPRHWPSVARDEPMSASDAAAAMAAAIRRVTGMPMEYAAGRANFRHLTLHVDARVLIPRPETEVLVDLVLDLTRNETGGTAVDVGTGSGAIAIALATEGTFARVIATDLSLDALAIARGNVARHAHASATAVELRHGSLLGPVSDHGLRAVVSNPPYIAFAEAGTLPRAVRDWEPPVALFSAQEGMAAAARLVRDAAALLAPHGVLALEVDARQAATIAALAVSHGVYADVRVMQDLTGRERFVVARRREEQG
ncbi:peptide chain release factor N(5)-glutamine methyltransferase [soil metagenome]